MQLADNWKEIVLRAWSIRWIAAAVALSGVEVILPYFTDVVPGGLFAALSGIVSSAALLARILAQPVQIPTVTLVEEKVDGTT